MVATLWSRFTQFLKRDDGPTAVEYAVMLALIIVVCLTSIRFLGAESRRAYRDVERSIGTTVAS